MKWGLKNSTESSAIFTILNIVVSSPKSAKSQESYHPIFRRKTMEPTTYHFHKSFTE